jgi:SpoVK/Ycf46/Vps4 family AAA+-type ATPase
LPALAAAIDVAEPEPLVLRSAGAIAGLLELEGFERELLWIAVAMARLPRLDALRARLATLGGDLTALTGCLAGAEPADAAGRVRRSAAVELGLLIVGRDNHGGGDSVDLHWRFARLLDEGQASEERLVEALAGIRQRPNLTPDDFAEHWDAFSLLCRLLKGALAARARGVNMLIYGPPGTGKTEFARALAAAAGASLFAVGEADEDGEEPTRWERLHALRRAQRLLGRRGDSLLLFDEMEDLFAEASLTAGQGGRRAGSKIFVNRLLEENQVPTLWTSNAIDEIDAAHLRRLSHVLRMDHPGPLGGSRIVARIAESEGAADAASSLAPLLRRERETAAVARIALRTAALAGGAGDVEAIASSLLDGLRGGRPLPPGPHGPALALDLYDPLLARLIDRLAAPDGARDFSLLLTGPPGTGKTALAAHLARRLDRPLSVRRASDLLSKWVGETEANIAGAFAQARTDGSVLLFDEVDSLLLDRADARHSWEVTQVNELLTWMDDHPLPFVAATNYGARLDPAALRRFLFKVALGPLTPDRAARAFEHFFAKPAPRGLGALRNLTPGDFALVKRQLRHRPAEEALEILRRLEAEAEAKPEPAARAGF